MPKWARTLPLGIFHWILIELPLHNFPLKYQLIFDTCCGLEVQKSTQVLTSFNGLGNTFDLNPKWARTSTITVYAIPFNIFSKYNKAKGTFFFKKKLLLYMF
jgi:hypothetical protein